MKRIALIAGCMALAMSTAHGFELSGSSGGVITSSSCSGFHTCSSANVGTLSTDPLSDGSTGSLSYDPFAEKPRKKFRCRRGHFGNCLSDSDYEAQQRVLRYYRNLLD